jgi:hypothetical protein
VSHRGVIFDYVRVLYYADDMKLFLPVRGFQDCMKIQSDLNKLSEWCERNSFFLNVDKCKTITLSRTCYPVEFACMLAGTVQEHMAMLASWEPIKNSVLSARLSLNVEYKTFLEFRMLSAWSGYQLPLVAGQNSIKIGSFLREQNFLTSFKLQRLLLERVSSINDLGGHHGREDEFFGVCRRQYQYQDQKTVIRVQKSIHSEISLHVLGSSEAEVRQLCMDPIL